VIVAATVDAPANGRAVVEPFPVESFRDAARHLRRPFTPAAVRFKVQATWPKDSPQSGLIVAYIDARLVVERLNLLVPHLWHDAYRPVGQGQMWCDLTVDGITRTDIGEGVGKGLVSDALKRAAVKFGIGVSLYAIPKMVLKTADDCLKQKRGPKGPTLELQPKGERVLRDMYEHWLDAHGQRAFGDPLDHGDVEGASGDPEDQGDPETTDARAPEGVDSRTGEITASAPEAADRAANARQRGLINARAAKKGLDHLGLLNVIRAAAGQEPVSYDDPGRAQQALNRNLDRLPARMVTPILDALDSVDDAPMEPAA
jgi:hypothetical protein